MKPSEDIILGKANEILMNCMFCVVASVNGRGTPEAAMVGFSHNDKFELIIGTSQLSRKYANIMRDNRLAVTFGPHENSTVQYEGQAQLQEKTPAFLARLDTHFEKLTFARKFLNDPDQAWFTIKPTWLRVSVYGDDRFIAETRQFA